MHYIVFRVLVYGRGLCVVLSSPLTSSSAAPMLPSGQPSATSIEAYRASKISGPRFAQLIQELAFLVGIGASPSPPHEYQRSGAV